MIWDLVVLIYVGMSFISYPTKVAMHFFNDCCLFINIYTHTPTFIYVKFRLSYLRFSFVNFSNVLQLIKYKFSSATYYF